MDKEIKFDEKKFEEQIKAADNRLKAIEDAVGTKLEAKDLETIQEEITAVKDIITSLEMVGETKLTDFVKNVQEQTNQLEATLADIKKGKGIEPKTLKTLVSDFVEGEDWKEHAKALQTSKHGRGFELKAAADLLTSDWTADTGTVGLPQMPIPGVTKHPWKTAPIFANVPKRTIAMDHEVKYTEELTRTDSAATKAEGSQYAQSGATWITKMLGFYDVGHFVKVSRESLEDAEYIKQEMNDLLYNGLLRALEYKLLLGTGSSDITGLSVYAKTFAKPLGLKAVSSAKIDDILAVARLFVAKGYNATAVNDSNKTGYPANVALIGAATNTNRSLEKDEVGRRLLVGSDLATSAGMSVLESLDLTDTDENQKFLVGDFTKAMLYLKRNLIIETGLDGNDFTYGMITLRASCRGNLLVKNLETYAFVYGDMVTAPALIE